MNRNSRLIAPASTSRTSLDWREVASCDKTGERLRDKNEQNDGFQRVDLEKKIFNKEIDRF